MTGVDAMDLLLEAIIAFIACVLFLIIGWLVFSLITPAAEQNRTGNDKIFYSLLSGLLLTVTGYSIAVTGFKTIHILVPLAGLVCIRKKLNFHSAFTASKLNWRIIAGIPLLA